MFHEKIKHLFSSSVNSVVSNISEYVVDPQKDFTRNKKSRLTDLFLFWFLRDPLPQKMKCWISLACMWINLLILSLTGREPNSNRKHLKLYFISLMHLLMPCILSQNIVLLQQTVLLRLTLANPDFLLRNTL